MIPILFSGATSFFFVILASYLGVKLFQSRNIGQNIQDELVFHEHKKGTPTMGGIFIVLGTYLGYFIAHINFWTIGKGFLIEVIDIEMNVFMILLLSSLMSLVGLTDDILSVSRNRNLGLAVIPKFFLQVLVSITIAYWLYTLNISTELYLFSGFGFEAGLIKYFIVVLLIVFITNSVNITDGLDGLVAGSSAMSLAGVLIVSFWMYRHPVYYLQHVNEAFINLDLSILIAALAGSALGFLWWNTNPAKIIMGDVGSHFIGCLIPLVLIVLQSEGLIFFLCFIYIIESSSVILQVFSYKYRKKRIFKMAPLHHHFEMRNWAETTVIVRFWIVSTIAVLLGVSLFYLDWVLYGGLM